MELIPMRNFTHPEVHKPKTSKSTKKLDVVSCRFHNIIYFRRYSVLTITSKANSFCLLDFQMEEFSIIRRKIWITNFL